MVPKSCGVDGNEIADKLAEQGSKMEQTADHPHDTAKNTVNRHLMEEAPKGRSMNANVSRKEQLEISRLRSGLHPELRYWKSKIGKCETELCRGCEERTKMFEHILLNWPILDDVRHNQPEWNNTWKTPITALSLWNTWIGRAGPD